MADTEWDTTDHRKRPTPPRPKWEGAGPEPPTPPHRWDIEAAKDPWRPPIRRPWSDERIRFRDERAVPPTKRLNASIPLEQLDLAVEGALSSGVDPKLTLAMMLQEGMFWPSDQRDAFLWPNRMLGKAAVVGEDAQLERQLQAFNGLGRPLPKRYIPFSSKNPRMGWYGNQDTMALPENFYGTRVLDVKRNAIEQTPEVDQAIQRVSTRPHRPLPMEVLRDLAYNQSDPSPHERSRDFASEWTREGIVERSRKPQLLK